MRSVKGTGRPSRIAAALFAIVSLGAVSAAQSAGPSTAQVGVGLYTPVDLGTLGADTLPAGINNRGQVVGIAYTGEMTPNFEFPSHPFLWENGTLTPLPDLGGIGAIGTSINEQGQIVGSADTGLDDEDGYAVFHSVIWQNGGIQDLGTLPGGLNSFAQGINEAGVIVGASQSAETTPAGHHPFRPVVWTGRTAAELPLLGGRFGWAYAVNDAGVIGGEAEAADGSVFATLWQAGQSSSLGVPPGAVDSSVAGLNSAGHAAVNAWASDGTTRATLFASGGFTNLGTLGGNYSSAAALNETDDVVGVASNRARNSAGGYYGHAFLWRSGSMEDLNLRIPADSGWELLSAADINASGQIVGFGIHNGEFRGFLLNPAGPDNRPLSFGCLSVSGSEIGGKRSVGQIDLAGGETGAPVPSHVTVRLRSSKPQLVEVPKAVRVTALERSATFPIRTRKVKKTTTVRITATSGGVKQVRELILFPRPRD